MQHQLRNGHWIEYLDDKNCIVWSIDYAMGISLHHDTHLDEFIDLFLGTIDAKEYLFLVASDTLEIDTKNLTGVA